MIKNLCFLFAIFPISLFYNCQISLHPFVVGYENLDLKILETKTKEELCGYVDKVFNYPIYNLVFQNFEDDTAGMYLPFSNTIVLKQNLSNLEFPKTLAHELVHKVFGTLNEKKTILLSLQILLESENDYLINSAKYEIKCQKSGLYKNLPQYNIEEFLA